jgi:hypothetical protein
MVFVPEINQSVWIIHPTGPGREVDLRPEGDIVTGLGIRIMEDYKKENHEKVQPAHGTHFAL